jgi:hypothetical protein
MKMKMKTYTFDIGLSEVVENFLFGSAFFDEFLFYLMTQSNSAAQAQELSSLEQSRATTHSVLDGISGDVGKKKSTLDKTVNCDLLLESSHDQTSE